MTGYRNGFLPAAMRSMTIATVMSCGVSMVLISALAAMYVFQPAPQSFAVSPSGQITKLVPLSEDIGQDTIAEFVSRVVVDSYSMDFLNWKKQLGSLSSSYTPQGYNSFMTAIEPLKNRVVEGRYITSVGLLTPPVLEKSALVDGVMKYRIGVDILIGLESQTKRIEPQRWRVEVIAQRVPFSTNPLGVAISSIVATQGNGNAEPAVSQ